MAEESRGLDSSAALPRPGWTTSVTSLALPLFSSRETFESVDHTLESWYSVALGTPAETTVHTRHSSRAAWAHGKARPACGQAHGSL